MKTILCIDDEAAILTALQRELSSQCRVLVANGPAQALAVLAKEPVDLVVSDFRMPGMDGLQLLHLLRKTYPKVVRIVLTANELDPASTEVAEAEAFRFLAKPWNRRDLHETVRRALDLTTSSPERELEEEHPGIFSVPKTESGFITLDPNEDQDPSVFSAIMCD
jgi:two-component system probable response regulator PhcQ